VHHCECVTPLGCQTATHSPRACSTVLYSTATASVQKVRHSTVQYSTTYSTVRYILRYGTVQYSTVPKTRGEAGTELKEGRVPRRVELELKEGRVPPRVAILARVSVHIYLESMLPPRNSPQAKRVRRAAAAAGSEATRRASVADADSSDAPEEEEEEESRPAKKQKGVKAKVPAPKASAKPAQAAAQAQAAAPKLKAAGKRKAAPPVVPQKRQRNEPDSSDED
jgi:hypothetical protein